MLARVGRLVGATARRQVRQGSPLAIAVGQLRRELIEHSVAVATCLPDQTSSWPSYISRNMTSGIVSDQGVEERRRRLNRILYRSRQRGYLELDLLLGNWATDHIHDLDDNELVALVEILEEENPDLLSWITGQSDAPEKISSNPIFLAIRKQVSEKLTEYSSKETRAQQGQPWVRGWDDNRQVGGPQVGNQ